MSIQGKTERQLGLDALTLSQIAVSDETLYLFIPQKAFIKTVARYFLLFFAVVFLLVLTPFAMILLPAYGIIVYKYYLFVMFAAHFNLSTKKLWIAAGVWCLFVCTPVSVIIQSIVL